VHEPSATDPEAEENNMFSTNISFWPKKKQKKNNHSNSFILPKIAMLTAKDKTTASSIFREIILAKIINK
jgi:hypothetical protein